VEIPSAMAAASVSSFFIFSSKLLSAIDLHPSRTSLPEL